MILFITRVLTVELTFAVLMTIDDLELSATLISEALDVSFFM